MVTILQLKVAKRRLFEKVSLERCLVLKVYAGTLWDYSLLNFKRGNRKTFSASNAKTENRQEFRILNAAGSLLAQEGIHKFCNLKISRS